MAIKMSTSSVNEMLLPFAKSIFIKCNAIKELRIPTTHRARFLESISDDIKKCTNFITPGVSKAAQEKANQIKIDICTKNWHDQHKFDNGRSIFHFEHIVPVKSIRDECISAFSEHEVHEILTTKLRVIWILKSEDYELTRLGYRSIRPEPEKAYFEAGIEIFSDKLT
jgi:hypothetical protein